MRQIITIALITACGCAHVAEYNATFTGNPDNNRGPLVLSMERHMDTIVRGPDIEEDQFLVLELRNFELNKRIEIPSENVKLSFTVKRFGPSSKAIGEKGYIIVKSVSKDRVVAHLQLDVEARTSDGTYTEHATFHSDFAFFREQ